MPPFPAATAPADTWTRTPLPRPAARLRLFCFHPAGAGPSLFRAWPAALPEDVELVAVQLPGRETRLAEPCLTTYQDAVTRLHAALKPRLDLPYVLFGHSMGALLAYGVARAALRHGDHPPARLLVSGAAGPGSGPTKPGRTRWSDEELVASLREMGGTPEAVLADRELLGLVLPTLRADYAVCDSFDETAGPAGTPLTCPVTVFGGLDDTVTPAELRRWAAVTTGPTSLHTFPGGHFFLTEESAASVLATISAELSG
ncbi:thioesterase II family protein [Kitasatospora sp. NPDC048296]|uniref:thioesterase II family protein n=1 Tax=Kitasatospora sp. NPDC048296 TaxID=3364048 RepID=UPI00371A076E